MDAGCDFGELPGVQRKTASSSRSNRVRRVGRMALDREDREAQPVRIAAIEFLVANVDAAL
jgi:hypothetical protein